MAAARRGGGCLRSLGIAFVELPLEYTQEAGDPVVQPHVQDKLEIQVETETDRLHEMPPPPNHSTRLGLPSVASVLEHRLSRTGARPQVPSTTDSCGAAGGARSTSASSGDFSIPEATRGRSYNPSLPPHPLLAVPAGTTPPLGLEKGQVSCLHVRELTGNTVSLLRTSLGGAFYCGWFPLRGPRALRPPAPTP